MTEVHIPVSLDDLLELEARISGRVGRRRSDPAASECYACGCELGPDAVVYRARWNHGRGSAGHTSWTIESVCEGCAPEPNRRSTWWWDHDPQPCQRCTRRVVNRVIPTRPMRHVFCSPDCERRYYQDRQQEKRRATLDLDKVCEGCDEPFRASRSDARYCSGACRQRAYRARKS